MSGWEPKASLEVGLSRTVDWYRHHLLQLRVNAGD
jgi:nucleoside-diphosphate-sugar epimerase